MYAHTDAHRRAHNVERFECVEAKEKYKKPLKKLISSRT